MQRQDCTGMCRTLPGGLVLKRDSFIILDIFVLYTREPLLDSGRRREQDVINQLC